MEANSDINEKIENYAKRANQLIENADSLARKEELEKAGEFYWGAVGCFINALELLYTGKAHAGHGEMVKEAKQIASGRHDTRLFDAVGDAEKLHANYYHSFISKDEFPKYYNSARYAISAFQLILRESLSKSLPHSSPEG